jgi:hypothetical protein
LSGFALGLAILTRIEMIAVPTIPMLALFLLPADTLQKRVLTGKRIDQTLLFILPVAVLTAATLLINILRANGQFSIGYSNPGQMINLTPTHLLLATVGNLFSPGRGLLLYFPLLLFSILGFAVMVRKNCWNGKLIAAVIVGFLLMYAVMTDWGAGISWGPRFLILAFPYLSVLAVIGLHQAHSKHPTAALASFVVLAALGWAATLTGQLISPLLFYGLIRLEDSMIAPGLYHFSPSFSPILSGWRLALNPANWDPYWIRAWASSSPGRIGPPVLMAITLSMVVVWLILLRKQDRSVPV